MSGLRVLFTNGTMVGRGGSVMYVRDLALALLRRGHAPAVYSPELGEVAAELNLATVPVVDDLNRIGAPPDVIHGNSHPDLMAALLRWPGVPAVFVCHGWGCWQAEPPRFPRLLRYLAVDDTCRDWLIRGHGLPPESVGTARNAVDLDRFAPRPPLPDAPRRALVFSHSAAEHNYLGAVRTACERAGLNLDVVGAAGGNLCRDPERLLRDYDLVFAKGRCALEAMAVGAAVVLCDEAGAGPLVAPDNWDQLRRLNFGRRALREPVTADWLTDQVARYDAPAAAEVCRRTRAEAGLDFAADDLIAVLGQVAERQRHLPPVPVAELRAVADYLSGMDTFGQMRRMYHGLVNAETTGRRLQAELDETRAATARLEQSLAERQAATVALQQQVAERHATAVWLEGQVGERHAVTVRLEEGLRERQAAAARLEGELVRERSDRAAACDGLRAELAEARRSASALLEELAWRRAAAERTESALRGELERRGAAVARLETELADLRNSAVVRWRERLSRLPLAGRVLRLLSRVA